MRRKLKMEVLSDYVSIFQIIYFCRCSVLDESEEINPNFSLSNLENQALDLEKKYEMIFPKLKIKGPSLILLKSQLSFETNKPIKDEIKHKILASKLDTYKNKLKLLECKHYALSLKYHK